ncbi:hypothetical protein L218DRAFT_956615 [Marasmius fiardii PR-910]|nr:hypothetical protein L218DRAFT_956615 [Marasmius fiardii PR-910]
MFQLLQLVLALGIFTSVALCSDPIVMLHSRQTINVPEACQNNTGCVFVVPFLQARNCPSGPDQCCTDTFANSLRDCLLCTGTTNGIQNYSQPQQTLDQFVASCAAMNHTISRPTLPGQDDGRSSASFNPSTLFSTTQQTTVSSNPTQTLPPAQTTNASRIPARWDINIKGLGVLVLWALSRAA